MQKKWGKMALFSKKSRKITLFPQKPHFIAKIFFFFTWELPDVVKTNEPNEQQVKQTERSEGCETKHASW